MVGNYSFSANFDRTNLKVGEALTLAISIKGDGTPGTITDPKLPDFSEFRSVPPENSINKKVKGNKVITSKDIKVFLYPKKKGTFEIPAITYSWFNPAKKKYETASAGPWTIEVEKSDAPAEPVYQAPVSAGTGTSAPVVQKQEIEFLGSDIRFIHPITDKSETAAPHRSVLFWILFAAAIPFYLIANFAITRNRKRNSNTALIRKIEFNTAQATNGTRTWNINFTANYVVSKRITMGAYFDYQTNTPLVSTSAYPTTSSNYGLSINMSLVK
jgi:hypothetical protein